MMALLLFRSRDSSDCRAAENKQLMITKTRFSTHILSCAVIGQTPEQSPIRLSGFRVGQRDRTKSGISRNILSHAG
jgi:uncharacterized protein YpuA (DUF1002 family)